MLREIERDSLYHCDPGVLIILPCQDKKGRLVIKYFIIMTSGLHVKGSLPRKTPFLLFGHCPNRGDLFAQIDFWHFFNFNPTLGKRVQFSFLAT